VNESCRFDDVIPADGYYWLLPQSHAWFVGTHVDWVAANETGPDPGLRFVY
jgi:hypothetical protein